MDTGTAVRDVGIIYLCRFAEGERPVHRFLESYLGHPAGRDQLNLEGLCELVADHSRSVVP